MAYVAVISLIRTLEQLVQRKPNLLSDETRTLMASLLDSLEYFQDFLENTSKGSKDCGKVEELEREIRKAVEEAEDVIELKIFDTMKRDALSKILFRTLDALKREVMGCRFGKNNVLNETMEKKALRNTLSRLIEKIDVVKRNVTGSSFGTNELQGYGDPTNEELQMRDSLLGHSSREVANLNLENVVVGLEDDLLKIKRRLTGPPSTREIVSILGMGGIGKTTLAKKAYDDPEIRHRFDIHIWVTVSQEYRVRVLLLGVVSFLSQLTNKIKTSTDDELMEAIYKKLKGRRYLVVMDDIWSSEVWELMTRIFPDDNCGSRIILTSRLKDLAMQADPNSTPHEMRLFNSDESWKLLHEKVFGVEQVCPPELEDLGRQVAQKCQGLPLAILVVAGHLSKIARTRESWIEVAKSVSKVVSNESDICLGVLAMSYNYLPNHLKPCFLYMGVFREDSEVNIETLINLWVSEGFLLEEFVGKDCLEDLVSRNLIMVRKRRFNGEGKTCGVHDLIRDLILREAEKEKFLQVTPSARKLRVRRYTIHSYAYGAAFWDSSFARTVHLFHGLSRFPLLERFKLLRVLAIHNCCFQDFPVVITNLVHLRYLELYCEDNIHREVKPGFKLQNLERLSCLCLSSCTSELFSAIPNLKRLKVHGDWEECEGRKMSQYLNSLSCLKELETLKFNGDGLQLPRIPSKFALPLCLKRLTLSYTSLPWEDMANIVMLPNLQELKIKYNGFDGDVWKLNDEEAFNQLKFLLISAINLKHWEASSANFPRLERLVLKRCYYLEEIPQDLGEICTLASIELHECSISAAKSVNEIQEEQASMGNDCLSIITDNCRWD
ncbi:PREDICTED: putative late blight resistance protein homolog R1A-10 isoform X2 [Nicotiana attenuata]|uniref:putative late blight resistance protein homolog R1A-10 isoform X2 n=1 Tax=Nicotiana attenuata TaxID=49451 RepID=UPI0009047D79|nr:PREDICTED: putative late blight resistance protein homolog R1A-10 isoform X2 [Nicotiana attenuata]